MARGGDSRIYVGNLPPDVREKDIEDLFYKYGRISFIDLKDRRGPPFAFIEFEDVKDAEDAVKYRDGYNYDGYTIRVEFTRGNGAGGGGFRGRGGYMGEGRGGGGRSGPPSRRSDYRVFISGLPPTGSWQDLKDHMREAGDVCYADVYKDGTGVVEYLRHEDMKYAVRKLDDTKFVSHEGESSYVRVKEDYKGGGSGDNGPPRRTNDGYDARSRSRSASPSRRRSRGSPSYSPARRSRSPY